MTVNLSFGDQSLQVLVEGYGSLGHPDRNIFQKRHPANQNQDASRLNQTRPVIDPFARDFLYRIVQPELLQVFGAQPWNVPVPETRDLSARRAAGCEPHKLAQRSCPPFFHFGFHILDGVTTRVLSDSASFPPAP